MRHFHHLLAAGSVAALGLFAAAGPFPAAAQSTGPAMTTEEIRVCLCRKQAMDQKHDLVDTQASLLDERQQELNSLDAEIKRQAVTLPPDDVVGQQVLQDLIHQQMALRNLIQLDIRPTYNRSLADLRQVIDAYNADCTARPRYTADAEEAEKNLVCPAP
ncbi:MAG TPA: hypothetical protein PLR41_03505 [Alphaproteobacteria bacterium]|nr:hypothetical protein [Alphaproteobacteria bacterium]